MMVADGYPISSKVPPRFQTPETRLSIWTAVAERSGDTALEGLLISKVTSICFGAPAMAYERVSASQSGVATSFCRRSPNTQGAVGIWTAMEALELRAN